MKCACDQCSTYVSDEGELCAPCASECFPVVRGQRTVATSEHRRACHRARDAAPPPPPPRPTTPPPPRAEQAPEAPSASFGEAAKRAGAALLDESRKKLVPALVELAREEGLRLLRGRRG